jgi:L-aspartate oxidase
MDTDSCDFIVVGSGIAGLRAAIDLAKTGSVRIFCKGDPSESNTRWAQGGIAAAMQEGDTVEFHLQDTLLAGDELCYEPAVRVLVEEGPRRIEELVSGGAQFDQIEGRFVFGREGAHSHNRILHKGDATGKEIVRALLKWIGRTKGIEIVPYQPAVDLVLNEGRCAGICSMQERTGECRTTTARAVLLATGGAGQIFSQTTNPAVATGDGVAMAYRAGAEMMDLEFYQFHPTAFHFSGAPRFLITEALRGEGATLKNSEGRAFMKEYHPLGDLAPRDVVSRAIVSEIKRTQSSWVYLDATSIGRRKLRLRFPNIYEFLQAYDLDLSIDLIPVSPSAHYWMGGVKTDLSARTSIPSLYAAGEVACTGVHGANRLASNSLLEGLVFGARAGEAMIQEKSGAGVPPAKFELHTKPGRLEARSTEVRQQLQQNNWENFGLIRNENGIRSGVGFLNSLASFKPANLEELELLNLVDCSKLMGSFALQRRESRGSHFREDFPEKNPQWDGHHTLLRKGKIEITNIVEE